MASVTYVDIPAIAQVIGGVYINNSFLDNEDYFFCEEDFTEDFHRILFEAIINLHNLGVTKIDLNSIEDYLEQRPKKKATFLANKGAEYLQNLESKTQIAAFDYYYNRMKKMTLLREYQKIGMDCSWLYDIHNIMDIKKKQAQEDWLDSTPLAEIADIIDKRIMDIRLKHVDDANEGAQQAGEGGLELLDRLRQIPELGYPMYGPLVNAVHRGARLKKFYLRSAATGVGKTRAMIADACSIACDEIYSLEEKRWISNGTKEPTIFISTEQEIDEIQTMMYAFLSGVDEEHIITGDYLVGEWERVVYAAKLLEKCPVYIQQLPDFSLQDIENTIKKGIRDYEVKYVFNSRRV